MDKQSFITGDIFVASSGEKTLRAWEPYSLCVGILFNLQNSDTEPRWNGWIVPWVGGLSLLRATGHVLQNVDKNKSSRHREVVTNQWQFWTNDKTANWVFWDFIQKERNNILKEFEFGFTTSPYLEPDEYEIEPIVEEKMQLFREAVYWWRQELRTMEDALK